MGLSRTPWEWEIGCKTLRWLLQGCGPDSRPVGLVLWLYIRQDRLLKKTAEKTLRLHRMEGPTWLQRIQRGNLWDRESVG